MGSLQLNPHPYLDTVLAELHARPVQFVDSGTRVWRLTVTVSSRAGSMRGQIESFRHFAQEKGLELGTNGARQFSFTAGSRLVTWEFHTEFITITWTSPLDDYESAPTGIGLEVLGETPSYRRNAGGCAERDCTT